MQTAASRTSAAERHTTLWRLHKNGLIAEARLYVTTAGLRLHLMMDGETFIGCTFRLGKGAEQAGALARSARIELESRGWTHAARASAESCGGGPAPHGRN